MSVSAPGTVEESGWCGASEYYVSAYKDYVAGNCMGKGYSACDDDYGYVAGSESVYDSEYSVYDSGAECGGWSAE